jgi:Ribbon-helix-helix protein, copG family
VHILTRQVVRSTKVADAVPQYPLLALQSLDIAFTASQLGQEMSDQSGHRCVSLGGLHAGPAIGLVVHGNSDIFHRFTLSQSSGGIKQRSLSVGMSVTYMEKTQVYLRKEELDALRKAAAWSGRSVAELVRDAIRKVLLKPQAVGPVAIWDGEPKRASTAHDSVHDEP